MPTHDTIYDFMADRFRAMDATEYSLDRILLDAEQAGYTDIWEMPRAGIVNAMRIRGIEVANGVMALPQIDGEHFDPIATDFAEFKAAARRIMAEASMPVPTHEFIGMLGLQRSAIPLASMRKVLYDEGIHHLPGVGYWRAPQYTHPDGWTVSKRIRSARAIRLNELIETHGWPIVGLEAEQITNGLVTSRFISLYASQQHAMLKGIGSGLYVPTDKWEPDTIPMSRNVADALLDIDEGMKIDDKDHLRLFRICLRAQKLGWATLHMSRTTRGHVTRNGETVPLRRQTMQVTWTELGLNQLRRAVKRTADVF